ncbi:superoxide dismutase family protein [Bacillus salacetis]|uniref:Superoxide dismutase [Cu-Zn] n=1 Tax=Bacillus salacetis TaxID=2315464 RepID=A0A3A1R105_9BACI|nr:superoxide dismutase family protein [Bacillus salacetis]RIW33293.1 superoxide dismutase family protein [Bacillus salacetis]
MTNYYGVQHGCYYGYPPYRCVPSISFAQLEGGPLAPGLKGLVIFREVPNGTEVYVEVNGLPQFKPAEGNQAPIGPHGFHLHEKGNCEVGDETEPFKAAGGHWNPTNQPHGNHAGDFPVLFSNNGYARMTFFTNKFSPQDVVGKAVIIHQSPDDYRSQPSGDAGKRLACGLIAKYQ